MASRYNSVFECINKYLDDRSFSDDMFSMLLFNNKVRVGFKRKRPKNPTELHEKIAQIKKKYPPHSTTSFEAVRRYLLHHTTHPHTTEQIKLTFPHTYRLHVQWLTF